MKGERRAARFVSSTAPCLRKDSIMTENECGETYWDCASATFREFLPEQA